MFFRKKSGDSGKASPADIGVKSVHSKVAVQEKFSVEKALHRSFPGPKQAEALLRVAINRGAYAELVAHAKEFLEVEVCGVLVGNVCQDENGHFIHVEAVIRGTAATQASTHVTFTQETWNIIHQTLERDYPKLRMVGWYHTHPGFGVEFSDMDLFIQKNFFPGPTRIALVTDPLNGDVAICVNTPAGIEYLPRFWVDGREQLCRLPHKESPLSAQAGNSSGSTSELAKSVQDLEERVSQLVQALDEQRTSYYRFLTAVGVAICLALIISVGYTIYNQFVSRNEPPRLNSYVPLPIQIGDKAVMVGLGIVEWKVPPELNAAHIQLERLKQEEAAEAAKSAKTNAPANNPPPDKDSAAPAKSPNSKTK